MSRRLQRYAQLAGLTVTVLLLMSPALAQLTTAAPDIPVTGDGKEAGNFKVTQSIDLGGRITSVSGSEAMYDTLVNLQSGPRILEQSLTMQSINHHDAFDTLTLNSFGWGGDPEQALRVRIQKYRWYSITGSYQHVQNYWNYDLFANPLNPPNVNPNLPVQDSPHAYYNRQSLYNIGLSLLPLRRVSLRFDYNRNNFTGPAFSSNHQGTGALLYQNTNNMLNGFKFGAGFHATKKTVLSYTQMFQWYSGQSAYNLDPYNSYPLSNGSSVSFGLPWGSGSPCNSPLTNGVANPVCNGFTNYALSQNIDTFIPTEQINLKSTSIKRLDFNGQFQYSGASMNTPVTELFSGLVTRSGVLGSTSAGSQSRANWVSRSADVSATYHISDKLRLVEIFNWRNWQSYGNYSNLQTNFFSPASAGGASLLNPIGIFPATILGHTSSSPADVINEYWANLDGQETTQNDFQVQYDISRNFGVRGGFRWMGSDIQPGNSSEAALGDIYFPNNPNRGDCVGVPLNPDGSCTFVGVLAPWGNPTVAINNYAWTIGAWFQKGGLNAHADATFGSANNYAYRIDPRTGQTISGAITYAPKPWLSAGADVMFQRATNYSDGSQINFNEHNYHAVFTATVTPNKFWALDVAYSFDAIQQDIVECFAGTSPANSPACFDDSGLLQTSAFYNAHTQYGSFSLLLRPTSRLAFRAGYSIVNNTGDTTQYNIYQPLGPLASRFQTPLAGLEYNFYRNMSFRGGWNYQNYGEASFVGPTAPRNFHANETTLAIRYAF